MMDYGILWYIMDSCFILLFFIFFFVSVRDCLFIICCCNVNVHIDVFHRDAEDTARGGEVILDQRA
jgi:hypothetical protein